MRKIVIIASCLIYIGVVAGCALFFAPQLVEPEPWTPPINIVDPPDNGEDPSVRRGELTLDDEQVTLISPLKSLKVHLLPHNQVELNYKGIKITTECGISDDGRLWIRNPSSRIDVSKFYPEVFRTVEGKVWFIGLPTWIDLSIYEIDELPTFTSLETKEGELTLTFEWTVKS